jgi:hypothetical protein
MMLEPIPPGRIRLRHPLPANIQPDVRSLVPRLLPDRRPDTVVRGVRPVIVFSLQRHSGRSLSHIGTEILKRHSPPLAADNAPTPIVSPRGVIRIVAAIKHRPVRRIERRPPHPGPAGGKTPAVTSKTSRKRSAANDFQHATIANAQPTCMAIKTTRWRRAGCHNQSAKTPAS